MVPANGPREMSALRLRANVAFWRGTVLPQKEFQLLYKLLSFPGRIFTRQQLMDDIWGYDSSTDTHTVDIHIARLRERFRDNPDFKIVTMRGVGYKVVRT